MTTLGVPMRRRAVMALLTTTALIGLGAPSLTSRAAAHPQRPRQDPSSWCSETTAPCINGATRNGLEVGPGDPNWDIFLSPNLNDGDYTVNWFVDTVPASGDMGTDELGNTWTVSIDMGHHIPRTTYTTGDDVTVTRHAHGDGTYDLTISGQPVTFEDNNQCDTSTEHWTCPTVSDAETTSFGGTIDDFGQWTDVQQRNDFYGMDTWTNVEESATPPNIIGDPAQLQVQMVNSHERPDSQVFHGFFHINIPNAFLVDMGVDDPSTLGAGGLAATIGAGTASATPGASSVQVDATGITFSQRILKVTRGTVTPTKPTKVHARRSSAHRAHLSFHHAKARGSKVTGYQARCVAHHHKTRTASGKHSPLVDKGLTKGLRYSCQVRAKSKAGYGPWSTHHTLARK